MSEALGPPLQQRRRQAQSCLEDKWLQRLAGVGVLIAGQIRDWLYVVTDHGGKDLIDMMNKLHHGDIMIRDSK